MLFINFLCLFYLMVLTYSYTISKNIYNDYSYDTIDSINDLEYKRENKPKHDPLHHNYKKKEKDGAIGKERNDKSKIKTTSNATPKLMKVNTETKGKKKRKHFWQRFRHGKKKKGHKKKTKRHHELCNFDNNICNHDRETKCRHRNKYQLMKRKRNVKLTSTSSALEKFNTNTVRRYGSYLVNKDLSKVFIYTPKANNLQTPKTDAFTDVLEKVTSDLMTKKPNIDKTTVNTISDKDFNFSDISQLENFLNNIKEKAKKTMSEQDPAINNIIKSVAVKTTSGVDTRFNNLEATTQVLKYKVHKRTAEEKRSNEFDDSNHRNFIIAAKTIEEDAIAIAQSIENELQNKLNTLFKIVKEKVSSSNKSTEEPNFTTVNTAMKIEPVTLTSNEKVTTPKFKRKRSLNHSVKHTTDSSFTTFDDYSMLNPYDKNLDKQHEDNRMKMTTNAESYIYKGKVPHNQYFKREYPSDLNVENDYKEVYPDDDVLSHETKETSDKKVESTTQIEDTSLKGLITQMSYNEYVNGYKNYLNFQKEQGKQNFSNLVRYQAHKHHNVDDIGKFILNKIPQVPRNKRFFDDDSEEEDVSTKSAESWFKKHFYFFVDKGPPNKYHTSQTVTLKPPTTKPDAGNLKHPVTRYAEIDSDSNVFKNNKEENNINLDAISEELEDQKQQDFDPELIKGSPSKIGFEEHKTKNTEDVFDPFNLVEKFMSGLKKRVPKTADREKRRSMKSTMITDPGVNDMLNDNNDFDRSKRSTIDEGLDKSQVGIKTDEVERRGKNIGYVDVNLIPRPTAIVKIRDNTKKKGKIKSFFEKHFSRNKKKNKKHRKLKRHLRPERFSLMKVFKGIFKSEKATKTANYKGDDYSSVGSDKNTVKPDKHKAIKNNKMKTQLPHNIMKDLDKIAKDEFNNYQKTVKHPTAAVSKSITYAVDKDMFTEATKTMNQSKSPKLKTLEVDKSKLNKKSKPTHKKTATESMKEHSPVYEDVSLITIMDNNNMYEPVTEDTTELLTIDSEDNSNEQNREKAKEYVDNSIINFSTPYNEVLTKTPTESTTKSNYRMVNDFTKLTHSSTDINKQWKRNIDKKDDLNIYQSNKNKNNEDKTNDVSLYLDTTLLSYDEGPDYLTEKPIKEKLSNTSFWYKKSKGTSNKPVIIINQPPEQYFSTPLPMKGKDFKQFLEDNDIDVTSLIEPIRKLPQLSAPNEIPIPKVKWKNITRLFKNDERKEISDKEIWRNRRTSFDTLKFKPIKLKKDDKKELDIFLDNTAASSTDLILTKYKPRVDNHLFSRKTRKAITNRGNQTKVKNKNGTPFQIRQKWSYDFPRLFKLKTASTSLQTHSYFNDKSKESYPKRVRISGQVCKYDIVYSDGTNKTDYERSQTIDEYPKDITFDYGFTPETANCNLTVTTKENGSVYIDLPTYFLPEIGPTENTPVTNKPKNSWNDILLRYISGLALIELLTKYGFLKSNETNLMAEEIDNAVNASKVFRDRTMPNYREIIKKSRRRKRYRQAKQSWRPLGPNKI